MRSSYLLACLLVLPACGGGAPRVASAGSLPPATPPSVHAPAAAVTVPQAQPPDPPPLVIDPHAARLVHLCRVWSEIRYLHPAVVSGRVDWDAALLAALPAALDAQSDDDEVAAMRTMLDALHDPATRIEPSTPPPSAAAPSPPTPTRTIEGVAVITVRAAQWQDLFPEAQRVTSELPAGKPVVLDLRASSREAGAHTQMVVDRLADKMVSHDATSPQYRMAEHRGYRPQVGMTSGGYLSLMVEPLPVTFRAGKAPHPSRVVFLTNAWAGVPDSAWAMQTTGDAVVVVQGKLEADELAGTDLFPYLPGHRTVHIRRAEPVGDAPRPDVELDASGSDDATLTAAVHAALHPLARKHARARGATAETVASWRPDATYADSAYPSRELRMLALFRFWGVIHYFYPYLHLMGDTWDRALVEMIPRFEAAADARAYELAVHEFAAKIPDGHVHVGGDRAVPELAGAGRPPFWFRIVDGHVVVTSLVDAASTAASGLAVGDLIVSVDGEPIEQRMDRIEKYVPGSNETWRRTRTAWLALSGDPKEALKLTLQGPSGGPREVTLSRTTKWDTPERSRPVYEMLDGNLGYADLDRLQVSEVDAMFKALGGARGIVFDMRGYPHGTAWAIGPRLNVRHARVGAQFFEPLVTVGPSDRSFFEQPIGESDPGADVPLYRGKTVMLIDERTMSQAEHTGLFFEAANGTTFVGSQTAGANGDVTTLTLPGGLSVSFSGHDVRHADGRQLQRTGLVPDVEVHPTLAGIRAGKDEVLERALAVVRDGK
jgi:C-terminal processing protease CtpA/Prc